MSYLNRVFITVGLTCLCACAVLAQSLQLNERLSTMNMVGSASFRFMFWSIYDAELYAEQPVFDFEAFPEFILNLDYQRSFTSEQIIQETEKQLAVLNQTSIEDMNAWLGQLDVFLVDVEKGDRISLYVDENRHSSFYFNGSFLGQIQDESFSRNFSSIWLARNDRFAEFSQELTGQYL